MNRFKNNIFLCPKSLLRICKNFAGDGCIFVWRLPQSMTSNMLARLKLKSSNAYNNDMASIQEQGQFNNPPHMSISEAIPATEVEIIEQSEQNMLDPNANQLDPNFTGPDYTFSVGKLPVWAKKQMTGNNPNGPPKEFLNSQMAPNQMNINVCKDDIHI